MPPWPFRFGKGRAREVRLGNACGVGPLAIAISLISLRSVLAGTPTANEPFEAPPIRGEFKADLKLLQNYYHAPANDRESNHLFDMWEGGKLAMYVRHAGLTNNHALIINSHSRSVFSRWRNRQALYPHDSLVPEGECEPLFSPRDLAHFLGPKRSAAIHNIVVGGCNLWGEFDNEAWRRHFITATNIVHVSEGDPGYQPMLMQLFFLPSSQIEPVYERASYARDGSIEYYLESQASGPKGGLRMEPYVADLFEPGSAEPYRRQVAGRELFLPPVPIPAKPSAPRHLAVKSLTVVPTKGTSQDLE